MLLRAETRLKLKMISNRGVKVWPSGNKNTNKVNHWRCRFVREHPAIHVENSLCVSLLALTRVRAKRAASGQGSDADPSAPSISFSSIHEMMKKMNLEGLDVIKTENLVRDFDMGALRVIPYPVGGSHHMPLPSIVQLQRREWLQHGPGTISRPLPPSVSPFFSLSLQLLVNLSTQHGDGLRRPRLPARRSFHLSASSYCARLAHARLLFCL